MIDASISEAESLRIFRPTLLFRFPRNWELPMRIVGQFPFRFYNDKMCTNLGVLNSIHTNNDSMYKECQRENCYQVFPFFNVSLFLFLILSLCSVM